jgi:hypothetical protein
MDIANGMVERMITELLFNNKLLLPPSRNQFKLLSAPSINTFSLPLPIFLFPPSLSPVVPRVELKTSKETRSKTINFEKKKNPKANQSKKGPLATQTNIPVNISELTKLYRRSPFAVFQSTLLEFLFPFSRLVHLVCSGIPL